RFATERAFPDEIKETHVSHPDFWLAHASGRDTLNVYNVESSSVHQAAFAPEAVGTEAPVIAADDLRHLGVTHLVTMRQATAERLVQSGEFAPVWSNGPLAIVAVAPRPGYPPVSSLLTTDVPASAALQAS